VTCAAGLTLWAVLTAGSGEQFVAAVGIFASAVLAVALVGGWPDVVPWAVALLGGQYAAALLFRGGDIDPRAPLYAALLLLTAELAWWGLETAPGLGGRLVVARRVGGLLALALGAAGAGGAMLAASEGGVESGTALELLGLVAAAATLGLVVWLAWRSRPG
jgi:hypothetical protein